MKKVLLATMILTTPALAGEIDSMINPLASVIGGYSSETANNGNYETRNTKDTSVQGTVGKIAGGTVTVGLTKRKETRTKVLQKGKLAGSEKANILSVKFVKIEPKWGFWGVAYAHGKAKNTIDLTWVTATGLGPLSGINQTGETTSKLTQMVAFAGTKITKSDWDIIPMVKYTSKKKDLESIQLTNGTTAFNSTFGLLSGKDKSLELSITGRKKIGDGVLALSAVYVNTKGTDIVYKVREDAIGDNQTNRIGKAFSIGYTLPLNDALTGDIFYRQYKKSETTVKTTYVGLTHKF